MQIGSSSQKFFPNVSGETLICGSKYATLYDDIRDTKWREWVLNEEQSRPIIKRALELGINFFDTADVVGELRDIRYSFGVCEEITGRALNDFAIREEIVVATKVFRTMSDGPNQKGLSRKHIFDACDASLKRLNMDYIDLYQIHRWDYETPIEETMEALH
ncbi:unnamed protein product, partial [Didymodactylos carnosus]